jgi:hypothetical protein
MANDWRTFRGPLFFALYDTKGHVTMFTSSMAKTCFNTLLFNALTGRRKPVKGFATGSAWELS